MTQPVEVTREKLLQDFNTVIAETEQLLKSVASAGGDKANAWRAGVEQNLAAAKDKLVQLEHTAAEKAKVAAEATDNYVHDKPWQAIGITAGVGVLVGLAVGMLLNRR
ncbi:MAG: DUF883 domain-containing protein [Betaproteobacteria bacterium]|nr:DUF883 domain-containing protein [Betaproteobacteria bacterium]